MNTLSWPCILVDIEYMVFEQYLKDLGRFIGLLEGLIAQIYVKYLDHCLTRNKYYKGVGYVTAVLLHSASFPVP